MKSSISRTLAGIGVIIIGALLLLDTLNVANFNNVLSTWWPLILIGVGTVMLINDIKNWVWGVVILSAGVLFQLWRLNILTVNPWEFFWPVVVIAIGLSILINRSSQPRLSKTESDDVSAVLGGIDQANTSGDYKGGKATAVLGGVKLDLRKSVIKKEATLEVFVLCGGIELIVPENVIVKPKAACILGGIDNKQRGEKSGPVLYVTGTVALGGIEIKT